MPAGETRVPSLKVICPKCYKGQQVVGEVPPSGLDHLCVFCKNMFKVRPPISQGGEDLPTSRDLPVARETISRPSDLPVARETIPRPSDLPVARETIPRPSDLPVSREGVPRPSDLPVSREGVPRPGDLPISRDGVPRPGDLPISRDGMPRPGDLPVTRDGTRPDDLVMSKSGIEVQSPLSRSERPVTKTPPLGLALDLSVPDGPDLSDLGLPPPPKAPTLPGSAFEPPRSTGTPPPPLPGAGRPSPMFAPLSPQGADSEDGRSPLAGLLSETEEPDLSALPPPPAGGGPLPNRSSGGGEPDLGFSLELEGNGGATNEVPEAIPYPKSRLANEGIPDRVAETVTTG